MDRRRFLYQITGATAVGAATNLEHPAAAREARAGTPQETETRSVTYQVKGFSCITCAVGLEAMLRGFRGVTQAQASYPDHNVVIGFDEQVTDEKALKAFVAACGFSVA